MADFVRQFIAHNRMLEGGFVIEDRLVTLADIDCPILAVVGTVDEIAPPPGVRAILQAAPRAEVYELTLHAGHFGLVVGSRSTEVTWPAVAGWARWRAGEGELPEAVAPDGPVVAGARRVRNRVGYGIELAAAVGGGIARTTVGATRHTVRGVRELAREAAGQLPRLARLEQIQPSTRISLGLLVEERRRKAPEETFFLFEDRAYTAKAVDERIDNVVRGLISIGVRQGEHVGVLMGTRPSALALAVAISTGSARYRCCCSPDGDLEREVELGQVQRIIADPERAALAAGLRRVHTFVLGGGGGPRELGDRGRDRHGADRPRRGHAPALVPAESRPRRRRRVHHVHGRGRRDADEPDHQPALGACRRSAPRPSAALTDADTVYSVTPPYHPSGLMMSIGGAIAGGSRLAMATEFNPADLLGGGAPLRRHRRLLHVDAAARHRRGAARPRRAPPPGAAVHRLGHAARALAPRRAAVRARAGCSSSTRRPRPPRSSSTCATSSPARWAGGCRVAPRSGSPPTTSTSAGSSSGRDGFARECAVDEVGMLLARVSPTEQLSVTPLRGVFARDDAWLATPDLFRRDADGDYWRVDGLNDVVRTADGPAFTGPIRDALYDIPAVDLAVAYGVLPARARPRSPWQRSRCEPGRS